MTSPQQAVATDAPDGKRVAEDLRCIRCGYNLRTLRLDAVCPECGTPVTATAREQYLRYAPRGLLARLTFGAALLMLAGLILVGGWLLLATVYVVTAKFGAGRVSTTANFAGWNVSTGYVAIALLFSVPFLGGVFDMTAPLPGETRGSRGTRAFARATGTLLAASVLIAAFVPLLKEVAVVSVRPYLSMVGRWNLAIGDPLALAFGAPLLVHLGSLMRRAQQPRVSLAARILLTALIACAVLASGSWLVTGVARSPAVAGAGAATGPASLIPPDAARRLRTTPYAGGVGESSLPRSAVVAVPTARPGARIAVFLSEAASGLGYVVSAGTFVLIFCTHRALKHVASEQDRVIPAAQSPPGSPTANPRGTQEIA